MKRNWRRRNYFINKELQGRYIFSFFVLVLACGFLLTAIFSLLSADSLTIVYKNDTLQLGKTPLILFREILGAHWIFIATGGVLVIIASLFLSHRVAGPLYRFEKSLEEMNGGNFDFEIRLRSKDEGKELARMLNDLNSTLSSQLGEMRNLAEGVNSHLAEISAELAGATRGENLDKTIALNNKLRDILNTFKLKHDE
jgi:methyl-accepting chemotaxis protein